MDVFGVDCNAAEMTAMVSLSDQTKGRVACQPGLHGGFKGPPFLLPGSGLGWFSGAGGSCGPGLQILKDVEKQRHVAPVSVWVHNHYRETEIKQEMKGKQTEKWRLRHKKKLENKKMLRKVNATKKV